LKYFFLPLFLLLTCIVYGSAERVDIGRNPVFIGDEIVIQAPVAPGKEMSAIFKNETSKAAIVDVIAGEQKNSILVKIIALENGLIEIPEIYINVDGARSSIDSFSITVQNRTDESDLNLREIKNTVQITENDYFLLWLLLLIFVLSLLAFLISKILKARKKEILQAPVILTPVEVAHKYIKLATEKRKEGDIDSFVDLVTIGIRDYMSLKQKINYKEMTTSEIRRNLKKDDVFSKQSNDIVAILKL